jgi:hypothetical protein
MPQFAELALAAVGHCIVAFHGPLTVGFDSNWGKYLPSILYHHARRYGFFMHQISLQPIRDRRKQLSIT